VQRSPYSHQFNCRCIVHYANSSSNAFASFR
jgi:hypothetical protein